MKKTNYPTAVLFTVFTAFIILTVSSCHDDDFDCIRGKGSIYTEIRATPVFNSVDLRVPAKVIITQDSVPGVEVRTFSNLQPEIFMYVNGSTLIIDADRCIRNRPDEIEVFIWAPDFSRLRLSGSGTIESANVLAVPDIDLHVSGSGSIDVALNTAMAYSRVSGSGRIMIEGEAYEHNVEISGSGSVRSFPFYTERANVSVSGSGNAEIRVFDRLTATISGSGTVRYKGRPSITSTISGSGRLIDAN